MRYSLRVSIALCVGGLHLIVLTSPILAQNIALWREVPDNRHCGVDCLVVASKLLGKNTDKREIATLVKLGPYGTNLKNLAHAARKTGLYCRGVRWSRTELQQWDKLAIAHYENDHFVLVDRRNGVDAFRVIDPPHMPETVSIPEFCEKWDGRLLLLSERPIPLFVGMPGWWHYLGAGFLLAAALIVVHRLRLLRRASRPRCILVDAPNASATTLLIACCAVASCLSGCRHPASSEEQASRSVVGCVTIGDGSRPFYHFDMGRVQRGERLERTLVLKNASDRVVEIKGVATSCSCSSAVVSDRRIDPGGSADIHFAMKTEGLYGKTYKPCLVHFTDANLASVKVDLTCFVYVPTGRFDKSAFHFDKVAAGDPAERTIHIINEGDPNPSWEIVEVRTSSPNIQAEYLVSRAEIRCTVSATAPLGRIDEKVFVLVKSDEAVSTIEFPVRAQIVNTEIVVPERIYLGTVAPGSEIERTVTVCRSPRAKRGSELGRDSGKVERTAYQVKLRAPDKPGFFNEQCELKTDSGTQQSFMIAYAGFVIE
jgi:hypothetical protein